jgi:hypothetical protein
VKVFKNPDIRLGLINGVSSNSAITRAVSYMALRNYPDKEVLSLIENAIATDTAVIPGEKTSSHYSKHRTKWGGKQQTLIIDILNKTKIEIKKKKMGNREDIPKAGSNNFTLSIQEHNILSTASDQSLGELYAPKIYLSTSDAWYGVDLYNADEGYFYTDYVGALRACPQKKLAFKTEP